MVLLVVIYVSVMVCFGVAKCVFDTGKFAALRKLRRGRPLNGIVRVIDLSPEALKARLTQRYFTDFAGSWLSFLNSLRWEPANNIADVTDQLTLMSDVRQSPMIALMNTLAWQGQTGRRTRRCQIQSLNRRKNWSAARINRLTVMNNQRQDKFSRW